MQLPVKNSYILRPLHATGKLGQGPHIFDRVNDRAEKRPCMRGRALNRWKLKMAAEILNFTTKSGTTSQRITEIFDQSHDV